MMQVRVDHGYLDYDKVGQGIPLLFIHGYPLSRRIWEAQLEGLADQATMLALDLRGHGDSFPFEGPYPMDLLADDCQKVLESAHIKPPVVVCGLSMGGYVTMALYRKYPQLFKGMILTSTRAGADSTEGKVSRQASIVDALEYGSAYIAKGMSEKIVSPETLTAQPELIKSIYGIMSRTSVQGIVGALLGMMERPDSTRTLKEVTCPVLIVHGIDDRLIPIKEARKMRRIIPHSKLISLSHAGHLPNMEQPTRFNQVVRKFLSSLN